MQKQAEVMLDIFEQILLPASEAYIGKRFDPETKKIVKLDVSDRLNYYNFMNDVAKQLNELKEQLNDITERLKQLEATLNDRGES